MTGRDGGSTDNGRWHLDKGEQSRACLRCRIGMRLWLARWFLTVSAPVLPRLFGRWGPRCYYPNCKREAVFVAGTGSGHAHLWGRGTIGACPRHLEQLAERIRSDYPGRGHIIERLDALIDDMKNRDEMGGDD